MNFQRGDLAIIVDGPWCEAIGKTVRIVYLCRADYGRGVSCDGLHYWMTADGPIYVVRPVSGVTLPAGTFTGKVLHRLRRRPVCGVHMRPLVRSDINDEVAERIGFPRAMTIRREGVEA